MQEHSSKRREKAKSILKGAGYGAMQNLVTKGVHEHEKHMHKGKKETSLKLATGGRAEGSAPESRLDRKSRAAGGRNRGKGKGKGNHVKINILNAGKQPVPVPMPATPAVGKPPMAPAPVGAAPPPPMGAMGRPPIPGVGLKSGGAARMKGKDVPHLKGGSGGGLGRLEKAAHEERRSKKLRA